MFVYYFGLACELSGNSTVLYVTERDKVGQILCVAIVSGLFDRC